MKKWLLFLFLPLTALANNTGYYLPGDVNPNSCSAGQFADAIDSFGNLTCATPSGTGIDQLTGDVTAGPGSGSQVATLATVNSNVGSFGSSTSIPSFTVNGKGLITAASGNAVVAPAGTLSGSTLASGVTASSLTSLGTQAAALNMGSHKLTSVTDPTSNQDAATKLYVDTQLNQLNPADAVYAASVANVAGTYTNAVSGICIADTFTTTATTAFALDGASPPVGARVLLKDQTSSFQDGVWTLTTQAVGSVSGAILTRALDFDSVSNFNAGQIIPVINGTVNAGSSWFQTATTTTCNTSTQTWTKFQNAAAAYMLKANNLSDVSSVPTSSYNLIPAPSALTGTTTSTIDWSLGNLFTKSISSTNTTFSFSNQKTGQTIVTRIIATSGTVTWPSVKWPGGTTPTQTVSGTDVCTFIYDGSLTYGSCVQDLK